MANTTLSEWDEYFSVIGSLNYVNASTVYNLKLSFLIGTTLNKFYRYEGSLTTPPCTEYVTWTVFQEPIQFTDEELEILRSKVNFEDFRDLQPLYNRVVYRNFPDEVKSSIPDYNCCPNSGGD